MPVLNFTYRTSRSGTVDKPSTDSLIVLKNSRIIDRIATHILAFEGECKVTLFDGNIFEHVSSACTPRRPRNPASEMA